MAARLFGKVHWFDDAKGFGFIRADDGSGDVFVHHQSVQMPGHRTLIEGERVEFEATSTPKGRAAINVVRLNG